VSDANLVPALNGASLLDPLPPRAALGVCPQALPVGPLLASARAVSEGRWTQ
jgi:hypothetical protein